MSSAREVLAPIALLLVFYAVPVRSQAPDADSETKKSIAAAGASFSSAYMRGDVEKMMDCYTQDAVIMPGGMDIISERDSIRAYWTLAPGRKVTHHRSRPERIEITGNSAYDYGYYEGASSRDGGDPVPFRGKYLIVWEKGVDGKWRMKVDMWSTRAPEINR